MNNNNTAAEEAIPQVSAEPADNVVQSVAFNVFDNAPKFGDLLDQPVVRQEFLFEDECVPAGEMTFIPGGNGTGKSMLAIQIAMQAATSRCFMRTKQGKRLFAPKAIMRVLLLSYEDPERVYRERIQNVIDNYPDAHIRDEEFQRLIKENLQVVYVPSLCNDSNLTTFNKSTREVEETSVYLQLKDHISRHSYDLVIIDPWHYTTSVEENDNNAQGSHVMLMKRLASDNNCGVIGIAHTTDGDPFRLRGATSVIDRARQTWQAVGLGVLHRDKKKYSHVHFPSKESLPAGVEASNVIWVKRNKNSYGKRSNGFHVLRFGKNGVLIPFDTFSLKLESTEKLEERIMDVMKEAGASGASISEALEVLNRLAPENKHTNKMAISRSLSALCDSGSLLKTGNGRSTRYKLAIL